VFASFSRLQESQAGRNAIGIVAMLAASLGYILNDACTKLVSERLPTSEIMFLRGLFATMLVIAVIAWTTGFAGVGALRSRVIAWRTIGELGATTLYLIALFNMPIANSTALLQVTPLMVTAASAIFFKDAVGWRRWSAVMIGFVGVLIIIRPGFAGFDAWSLVVIAATVFIVLRDLTTRLLPPHVPSVLVTAVTSISVMLLGATGATFESWKMPHIWELAYLAVAAVFVLVAYFSMIITMRIGDPSVSSPFRYSIAVYAIVIGFFVWGDVPDLPMIIGTLIIIATGVYTFRREARLAKSQDGRRGPP